MREFFIRQSNFNIPLLITFAILLDPDISPQLSMKDIISDRRNSKFVEDLPPGEFHLDDAMLSEDQVKKLNLPKVVRAAINDDKLRWTNANIPYEFDCSIGKIFQEAYKYHCSLFKLYIIHDQ